jgi:2,3-bisphosphoglycerate-dependent phosphoglycerate mutase
MRCVSKALEGERIALLKGPTRGFLFGRWGRHNVPSHSNYIIKKSMNRPYSGKSMQSGKNPIPLIFLRHGQSTWNKQNIFIGMTDTPLTPEGVQEAKYAGRLMKAENVEVDLVYTSLLRRSTKTVWLAMQEIGLEWVPVVKDFLLNERNYGALVGMNKEECVKHYGSSTVRKWRRSWDTPPPPMDKDHDYWPYNDPRYAKLGITEDMIPLSESLKDVTKRTSVFWDETIVPQLRKGKRIMIVGHENNLRSIIKRLDNISAEDILHVELPRAIPLEYMLDPVTFTPIPVEGAATGLSGRYLESEEVVKEIYERDLKLVYGSDAEGIMDDMVKKL